MLVSSQDVLDELEVFAMLSEAKTQSGLTDFGDESFVKALHKMREYYAKDIRVDAKGLKNARDTPVRQLVNCLRFQNDLKRHPEIMGEDVSDPIIILGLPRSGTTKTHRMMGVDPNLLKTYMWQLVNPAPFPDAIAGDPDPRILAATQQDKLIEASSKNIKLRAGHHYGSEEVQEDLWLFGFTFNCNF
jgi:hypothetical protein